MKKYLWTLGLVIISGGSLVYSVRDDSQHVSDDSKELSQLMMTLPLSKSKSDNASENIIVVNSHVDNDIRNLDVLTDEQIALADSVDVAIGEQDLTLGIYIDDPEFINQVAEFNALEESWENSIASSTGIDLEKRPAGWNIVGVNYYDPMQTGITESFPELQSRETVVVAKVDDTKRKEQVERRNVSLDNKLDNHPERQELHELRKRLIQE